VEEVTEKKMTVSGQTGGANVQAGGDRYGASQGSVDGVAPMQHKLGCRCGGDCQCKSKKKSKSYCGDDSEDTDLDHQRAKDMEGFGNWTTERLKPRTHPLDVDADPCSMKGCGCEEPLDEGVRDWWNKLKTGAKKAWAEVVKELGEAGTAGKAAYKLMRKSNLSDREREILAHELKTVAKTLGYASVFALPAGSALLPLVKYVNTHVLREEQEIQLGPYTYKVSETTTAGIPGVRGSGNVISRFMKLTDPDQADDFIEEPEGSVDELPDELEGDPDFFMTGKDLSDFRKAKQAYNPDTSDLDEARIDEYGYALAAASVLLRQQRGRTLSKEQEATEEQFINKTLPALDKKMQSLSGVSYKKKPKILKSDNSIKFYLKDQSGKLFSIKIRLAWQGKNWRIRIGYFDEEKRRTKIMHDATDINNINDIMSGINKSIQHARRVVEATISGGGVGVAGTDTRLGGPTFEPNFFDEKSKDNNAIRNEKVFYKKNNEPVLMPGWFYVTDITDAKTMVKLTDLRFAEDEIEEPELESWEGSEEGIGMKKKTGIDWSLDDGSYRKHLARLRKSHNI
jgi:hypothetical protein